MNETTVVKIITNTLAASSYANIVGSTLSSSAACLMLIFPYFNCSRICRLPASKILDEGTMEGAPSLKNNLENEVFGIYLVTQFHISNIGRLILDLAHILSLKDLCVCDSFAAVVMRSHSLFGPDVSLTRATASTTRATASSTRRPLLDTPSAFMTRPSSKRGWRTSLRSNSFSSHH